MNKELLKNEEKEKYEYMWKQDSYRENSPAFHRFFDSVKSVIDRGDSIIEFGCGTGVGLAELGKTHDVTGVDIAKNCLSEGVNIPFVEACLWDPINLTADVGFCVDVMEHIPTERVSATFREIMKCVPKCLFIVCKQLDSNSRNDTGPKLHLTVKKDNWWINEASKYGKVKVLKTDGVRIQFIIQKQ